MKTKFNSDFGRFKRLTGKDAVDCTDKELNKSRKRMSSIDPDKYAKSVMRGLEYNRSRIEDM